MQVDFSSQELSDIYGAIDEARQETLRVLCEHKIKKDQSWTGRDELLRSAVDRYDALIEKVRRLSR